MLLGNANVERPLGMRRGELVDAGPGRHRGRDRADFGVGFGQLRKRFAEDILVRRRAAARPFVLLARHDVEFHDAVIFVRRILGRAVALALVGHDMNQHRPDVGVANILEHLDERLDVMPVDRSDVIEAELVEERAAGEQAARIFFHLAAPCGAAAPASPARASAPACAGARYLLELTSRASELRSDSDRRRDRHVVVVEDDDQPVSGRRGIVHRLIGHAGAHRAVADHRDRLARRVGQLVGNRETRARPRWTSSCAPRRTGRTRSRCAW